MAGAYHHFALTTAADGSIAGRSYTNDDEDRGYPTTRADWPVKYRDFSEMKRRTGLSHIGISGVRVTVFLDGAQI